MNLAIYAPSNIAKYRAYRPGLMPARLEMLDVKVGFKVR